MAANLPSDILINLEISERRRQDSQKLSGVGFWELEHPNGNLYWSEEIFTIYNICGKNRKPDYPLWLSLIHDADREYVQKTYEDSVKTGAEYNIRYRIKAQDTIKWIEARGTTYYDQYGKPERTIGTALDVSEIKIAQEKVEHFAYHDILTDLPNRKLFSDTLNQALSKAKLTNNKLAVLFIDLDNFKAINDQYGHTIGDDVLIGVARNLQKSARTGEIFARIGGDEFAGLLLGKDETEIKYAVQSLRQAINTNYEAQTHVFKITASIGVTLYPRDDVDTDILIRHADQAMYEAKEQQTSGIRYFDIRRSQSIAARCSMLKEINTALFRDEFELFYQPRVHLSDGALVGAEALLRWFRPQDTISPSEIVSAIKNTAEEWALDKWVIKTVLSHTKIFKEAGIKGPFSLNINPSSVVNPKLPDLLHSLLSASSVSGEDIEIEILELKSIENLDIARNILQQCKELGVTFSLDDFGTGYSSLTHFHALPISKLKIDQRFIKKIDTDIDSLTLVKSILAIANANNKPVVAEGIESAAIMKILNNLKCEYGQGYGIAFPMSVSDYLNWKRHKKA